MLPAREVEALLKEPKKPKEKPVEKAPPILSADERKEAVALFKGDAGAVVRADQAGSREMQTRRT